MADDSVEARRLATTAPPPRNYGEQQYVYLHPGQLFASNGACEISMVLGSCVAVCLHDSKRRVGGSNHFLLPFPVSGAHATPRFGSIAIRALLEQTISIGAHRDSLEAKLFGGASVAQSSETRTSRDSLGWKNVLLARKLLAEARIPIIAEDVGGTHGRRLVFRTDLGFAWVKRL